MPAKRSFTTGRTRSSRPGGYHAGVPDPQPPSVAAAQAKGPSATPEAAPAPERAPDPLASAVAKSVRELRRALGLSERAAARVLGTSQTQLRRMEDPRYLPSLRSLARLATAYGRRLSVEFLPIERPAPKPSRPTRSGGRSASPTKAADRGRRPAAGGRRAQARRAKRSRRR